MEDKKTPFPSELIITNDGWIGVVWFGNNPAGEVYETMRSDLERKGYVKHSVTLWMQRTPDE